MTISLSLISAKKDNFSRRKSLKAFAAPLGLATETYASIRKKLWHDLHPRVCINIRNRDLSLFVNNATFDFWTIVAKRNPAFDNVYKSPGTAVARSLPTSVSHHPQPAQFASPATQSPAAADSLAIRNPADLQTTESRLESIRVNSFDGLIKTAAQHGLALLEDFLPDAKRQVVMKDFTTIKDIKPTRIGDGVLCYNRKPSAAFREVFDDVTLAVTKALYGIGYRFPRDRFAYIQRLELIGDDRNDPNTILHIDRHIPSIKFFYYPHPIVTTDLSPFGYIPESHFITEDYVKQVRATYEHRAYESRPFAMRNPTTNSELPILVQGNTLMLTYTNGLHRRTPFGGSARPGAAQREAVTWMFYNLHTRFRLLSQAL